MTTSRGLVSSGASAVPAPEDTLYLPRRDDPPPAPGMVSVDLAADADGTLTGTAFTSLEAFVTAYGPDAPWVSMTARDVGEQMLAVGVRHVALDPVPPPAEDDV